MTFKTLAMLHVAGASIVPDYGAHRAAAAQASIRRPAGAKVHWLRPEIIAEMPYLTWSEDGLLRDTVITGLRNDKPAKQLRRERPSHGHDTSSASQTDSV